MTTTTLTQQKECTHTFSNNNLSSLVVVVPRCFPCIYKNRKKEKMSVYSNLKQIPINIDYTKLHTKPYFDCTVLVIDSFTNKAVLCDIVLQTLAGTPSVIITDKKQIFVELGRARPNWVGYSDRTRFSYAIHTMLKKTKRYSFAGWCVEPQEPQEPQLNIGLVL
jgi:hypothetical protein